MDQKRYNEWYDTTFLSPSNYPDSIMDFRTKAEIAVEWLRLRSRGFGAATLDDVRRRPLASAIMRSKLHSIRITDCGLVRPEAVISIPLVQKIRQVRDPAPINKKCWSFSGIQHLEWGYRLLQLRRDWDFAFNFVPSRSRQRCLRPKPNGYSYLVHSAACGATRGPCRSLSRIAISTFSGVAGRSVMRTPTAS